MISGLSKYAIQKPFAVFSSLVIFLLSSSLKIDRTSPSSFFSASGGMKMACDGFGGSWEAAACLDSSIEVPLGFSSDRVPLAAAGCWDVAAAAGGAGDLVG